MYSRQMTAPPEKLVKNGKPVFGTFDGIPPALDIRGVRCPFGVLPLPTFITDLRIRSSLAYIFNTDEFIGAVSFLDLKIVGHGEVLFWNKKTGRKYVYHTVTGPRRRLISKNTGHGACISFGHRRYIRLGWDMGKQVLSLVFNLKGDSVRPQSTGAFKSDLSSPTFHASTAVLPAPTMRRCRGVWLMAAPLEGSLSLHPAKHPQTSSSLEGSVLFKSVRSYNKLRTRSREVWGTGKIRGKSVSFAVSSSSLDAVNPDTYNENILFVEGELTPLPPVKITFPFGIRGKWIIQDTENMVDLSFTPISDHNRTVSLFVLRAQKHVMYGVFEGMLRTKDGEEIIIKDFPGVVRKQLMRL